MYVNQYTVAVKTLGGTEVTFDDSTDAGAGAAAYAALEAKQDIKANVTSNDETTLVIIPFHAVDSAAVSFTRTQAEDPADPTCPTE